MRRVSRRKFLEVGAATIATAAAGNSLAHGEERKLAASPAIPAAMKLVTDRGKKAPTVVSDFRTVLDDPKLDVLVCSAPDHWHALATILACQAGKDVYVEKPVSHNVVEGRRMVEAARKYNRVVQAGTQRRSSEELALAVERVRSGRLGKVHLARAWITSVRPEIGHQ